MRTLVIQFGRVGDVIQTTPLLRDLLSDLQNPIDLLLVSPNQHAIASLGGLSEVRAIGSDARLLDDQIATGVATEKSSHRGIGIPSRTVFASIWQDHQCLPFGAGLLAGGTYSLRPPRRRRYRLHRVPIRRASPYLQGGSIGLPRKELVQPRRSAALLGGGLHHAAARFPPVCGDL